MNATQANYYDIMGVDKNASQEDIRKAYLKLAKIHHPDRTGGDEKAEDKLKEINAAYDTLKNPEKRKEYDEQQAYAAGGFGGFDYSEGGGAGFEDIFSSMFGAGAARGGQQAYTAARAGNSLEARIGITLKDVLHGIKKTLQLNRLEECTSCSGSGAAPGTSPVTCMDCQGSGHVNRGSGFFNISQTCARCHGSGKMITSPCGSCSGSGRVRSPRTISVSIPKGITDGARLRLAGEGEPGYNGGPRGDLFVAITVQKDKLFIRNDSDIICEVPITFAEAALGGKIDVPTVDGKIARLSVPAGTQNGAQLRMKGMGLPKGNIAVRGDELIQIVVEIPRKLNKRQKELLSEFSGESVPKSHPLVEKFKSFLDGLGS